MGKSLPPPAAIDLVGSFARRRGPDVEMVLNEPKSEVLGSSVRVTLSRGRKSVEARGSLFDDSAGRRIVVRAPRNRFGDGTWAIGLHTGSGPAERLDARLLVQGQRPLVLLWGAEDRPSIEPTSRRRPTLSRRGAARAGKILDGTLSVLPEEQAVRLRSRAQVLARRVLR